MSINPAIVGSSGIRCGVCRAPATWGMSRQIWTGLGTFYLEIDYYCAIHGPAINHTGNPPYTSFPLTHTGATP